MNHSYTDAEKLIVNFATDGITFIDTWEQVEANGEGHIYDVVMALCHVAATIAGMHAGITGIDPEETVHDILDAQTRRLIQMDTDVKFEAITGGLQ